MTERIQAQTRTLTFDLESRQAGDAGIPVVVSTDAVVEVADGPEILVHTPDAVDLRRAPLPMIATHRSGQINVGLVDNLRIENGQLRGMAKFGKRPEADGYRIDVEAGIIRSVSVGYARLNGKVRGDGVLVTTRWMPSHTAMIAEPADVNAGFFRELPKFEIDAREDASTTTAVAAETRSTTMTDATVAAPAQTAQPAQAAQPKQEDARTTTQMMEDRVQAIRNISKANGVPPEVEAHWIRENTSWNEIGDQMIKFQQIKADATQKTAPPFLDLEKRDLQRYSLFNAIRACMNRDWSKAGLELACNKELSKRLNRIPRTETAFFVPLDVQHRGAVARRDMDVAGTSGSNYLVSTDNQPGSFIELLANESVCLRMGATRMSGLVGNVTIPKMTAGTTAYWLADETTQITEAVPTIGQVALSPKNVAALTELSHQLLQQSTPDAEQLILRTIARDIGLAVDVGILRGSGNTGQPHGIVGTAGVGAFTGTSLAAPGVLDAIADVASANALMPGAGFVTTPAVAALLMARPELPTTGTTRLWAGGMGEGSIFGQRAMSSAQMASATAIFGWFGSVILAEWGVLELMTNPFSDFTRGLTAVRGWYTCDVGLRYAAAFSYSSSIT